MSKPTLESLLKRLEMIEAAVFGQQQEKITSKERYSKPKKKKKLKNIIIPPDLEILSHTEIVEISRHVFSKHLNSEELAKITIQISKDDLISAIKGETQLGIIVDPIGSIRDKIFSFINLNENTILKSNLTCSVYCPTCPTPKVVNCYSVNKRRVENEVTGLNITNNN